MDDGKGLDVREIEQSALSKKLIKSSELPLTEEKAFSLLFEPGFSTAKETTEHAGRGVGLDLVKAKVEQLGGNIKVASKPGKGTHFTITIPV